MFVSVGRVGFIVDRQREKGTKIVHVEEGNVADVFKTATRGGGGQHNTAQATKSTRM